MKNLTNKLLSILSQEIKLYEEFLTLLQKEKKMMLTFSLEGINITCQQKETLLLRIKIMEETRIEIMKKIAPKLNLPLEELYSSNLAKYLDPEDKKLLENYKSRLLSLFSAIKDLNQLNGYLSEHSLDYIEGTIQLLKNLAYPDTTYMVSGKLQEAERPNQMLLAIG